MKGLRGMPAVGIAVVSRRTVSLVISSTIRRFMSSSVNNSEHKPFGLLPQKQGMYDPGLEKDNCGVGMIANLRKDESHRIVKNALQVTFFYFTAQECSITIVVQLPPFPRRTAGVSVTFVFIMSSFWSSLVAA
jgi:hypothetical protein